MCVLVGVGEGDLKPDPSAVQAAVVAAREAAGPGVLSVLGGSTAGGLGLTFIGVGSKPFHQQSPVRAECMQFP